MTDAPALLLAGGAAQGMRAFNDVLREACGVPGMACRDLAAALPRRAESFYDDMHLSEAGARPSCSWRGSSSSRLAPTASVRRHGAMALQSRQRRRLTCTRGLSYVSGKVSSSVVQVLRYRTLVKNLVFKDLKLKYRDSVLGVVWSLLNPLLLLVVYTMAFKFILRVQTENYAYFLLVGLLPWNFFSSSLIASTHAITGNANLIKKVYFPRETLPIATVLFTFSQLLLALAVFLPALLLVSGVRLHWAAVLFIPLLLLHLLFTLGLAFMLATCTVFFRDVAHLTEVAVVLLFWMTPIIYPVTMAPAKLQLFYKLSPLAAFAIAYQDVLFWGRVPEELVLSTLLGSTVAGLLGGYALFRRFSWAFAEGV